MSNPRPCRFCDLTEAEHDGSDGRAVYFPKKRTEPLRARPRVKCAACGDTRFPKEVEHRCERCGSAWVLVA